MLVVLLVLWYCHKRGREVRLENERLVTEAEIARMNDEYEEQIRATETLNTTAPKGASVEEVHEGVQQVQKAREETPNDNKNDTVDPPATTTTATPAATTTSNKLDRRFSLFKSSSKKGNGGAIRPYPGT